MSEFPSGWKCSTCGTVLRLGNPDKDEITRLSANLDKAVKALEPFAALFVVPQVPDDAKTMVLVDAGEIRLARATLTEISGE